MRTTPSRRQGSVGHGCSSASSIELPWVTLAESDRQHVRPSPPGDRGQALNFPRPISSPAGSLCPDRPLDRRDTRRVSPTVLSPKGHSKPCSAYVPNRGEVEEILAQPDLMTTIGLRDRAILETLYSTGIRRCEIVRLTLWDIDRERGVIAVRMGKGRRDRMVPIGTRALAWLEKYRLEAARVRRS